MHVPSSQVPLPYTRQGCACVGSKVTLLTSDMCLCRFKVTVLKANSLPAFATNLNFPLLENDEEWIVQGYTYVSHRLASWVLWVPA